MPSFRVNYLPSFQINILPSFQVNYLPSFQINILPSFQVTISATEDSLLISWPHRRLKNHLSTDSLFENIFHQLIGKDISHKLYQIQEKLLSNPDYMETLASRRSSMVNVRNSIVSMSAANLTKLNCLQGMRVWYGCYALP